MRNLASVDLNLLVAFDALLSERSVSRAAHRVGLSQPAMSGLLARLRALFDDELFVRTPAGMKPTARAMQLAAPISEALRHVRVALDQDDSFDPRRSDRRFTIGVTYYGNFTLLPAFIRMLREEAPKVSVRLRAVGFREAIAMLDEGQIDFAIGVLPEAPKRISLQPLLLDRAVCIARVGHPVARSGVPLDTFIALPHARMMVSDDPFDAVDDELGKLGLGRHIAFAIENFYALAVAVASSDLIAVVPARVAAALAERERISAHPLPIELTPQPLCVAMCRDRESDAALRWLRDRTCAVCRIAEEGSAGIRNKPSGASLRGNSGRAARP
jgi:DNA-binding transcriptional LysR family regulator